MHYMIFRAGEKDSSSVEMRRFTNDRIAPLAWQSTNYTWFVVAENAPLHNCHLNITLLSYKWSIFIMLLRIKWAKHAVIFSYAPVDRNISLIHGAFTPSVCGRGVGTRELVYRSDDYISTLLARSDPD